MGTPTRSEVYRDALRLRVDWQVAAIPHLRGLVHTICHDPQGLDKPRQFYAQAW